MDLLRLHRPSSVPVLALVLLSVLGWSPPPSADGMRLRGRLGDACRVAREKWAAAPAWKRKAFKVGGLLGAYHAGKDISEKQGKLAAAEFPDHKHLGLIDHELVAKTVTQTMPRIPLLPAGPEISTGVEDYRDRQMDLASCLKEAGVSCDLASFPFPTTAKEARAAAVCASDWASAFMASRDRQLEQFNVDQFGEILAPLVTSFEESCIE